MHVYVYIYIGVQYITYRTVHCTMLMLFLGASSYSVIEARSIPGPAVKSTDAGADSSMI